MSDLSTWSQQHRTWVGEFVRTLQQAGAPEDVIATRLSQTHRHCEDGGWAPEAELGTGQEHAASLGYHAPPEQKPQDPARAFQAVAAMVVLMLVGSYAVRDWILGTDLRVNIGTAGCWAGFLVLLAAGGLLALRRSSLALNFWVVLGLNLAAAALGVAGAVLSRTALPEVYRGSPVPVALVTVVLVLGIAVLATRWTLRSPLRAERPPRAGDVREEQATADRRVRVATVLPYWIVPVVMAVDAVFTAVAEAGN